MITLSSEKEIRYLNLLTKTNSGFSLESMFHEKRNTNINHDYQLSSK